MFKRLPKIFGKYAYISYTNDKIGYIRSAPKLSISLFGGTLTLKSEYVRVSDDDEPQRQWSEEGTHSYHPSDINKC